MRTLLLLTVAVVLGIGATARADPPSDKRPDREKCKKEFMAKYDKNKDGKLDECEKKAIRAEWAKRHQHARPEAEKKECPKKKADPRTSRHHHPGDHHHHPWSAEMKKKILEKYDANKDGKLDENEKKCMRDAWAKRIAEHKKEFMAKYDKNKDGKIDEAEKKAMRAEWAKRAEQRKKEFMAKYDKNKDGKLDDEEKQAIRAEWAKRHEQAKPEVEKKKRPKKNTSASPKKRPKQRWRDQKNKGKPKGPLGKGRGSEPE